MSQTAIQPIARALLVLRALNQRPITTLENLHQTTNLPKPTIIRLLDTLITTGYVIRLGRRIGYRLTEQVLNLSDGFQIRDQIIAGAIPLMHDFTKQHKWPVALATFEQNSIVLKYSTMQQSPLSYDFVNLNSRISIARSALGLAYLANRPGDEQSLIIDTLTNSDDSEDFQFRSHKDVKDLMSDILLKGYASTPQSVPDTKVMGIAVPVLKNGYAEAVLTLRYYYSAMRFEDAIDRYLTALQQLAENISLHVNLSDHPD